MPIFINPPLEGTSGTDTFPMGRDIVVRRALRMVGAYTSTDLPRPEQLQDAILTLNMMLKTWSTEGFLWLRQFITVPMVAGQNSYVLGPNGATAIDRPVHVFNCNRRAVGGNEIPIIQLTRTDYMAIPNKTTQGVPVQFYYDAQTVDGTLYVWPAPSTGTTDVLVLDVDRQLDMMNDNLNSFDLPPQWYEVVTYSLAARLAPEYGLPLSERNQLIQEATGLFNKVVTDDRDLGSIQFQVRRQ